MKKGFTLVELLAVIVILAVILIIAIPQVLKVVDNSRINAYIKNEQMVLKAVDVYVSRNTGALPGEIGSTTEVSINYLVSNGMLTEIKNLYNKNEDCTGYVTITKLSDTEYNYIPHLKCGLDIHNSSDDGLVAHYKFDGNAFDYSINNNHGIINGVEVSKGLFNKAYKFDGSTSYIDISGVGEHITGTNAKTIMAWINTTTLSGRRSIVSLGNNNHPGGNFNFEINMNWSGGLNGSIGVHNAHTATWTTEQVLNNYSGQWVHIAVVSPENGNIGDIKLYFNGISKAQGFDGSNTPVDTVLTDVRIGSRNDVNSQYYNGLIDNIIIYNRALSKQEISNIYIIQRHKTNK